MLSINSILRQGRYRIVEQISSTASHDLYEAYDNLLGNKVVLHEAVVTHPKVVTSTHRNTVNAAFAAKIQTLKDIRHDGIVRVRDGFTEIDRRYLVTEPVEARPERQEFLLQPAETISRLLLAIEFINKIDEDSPLGDITPSQIRRTSDGNNRLLYFGPADHKANANERENLPFRPLESLWNGLDLASQKAISNGYDEASLETLESRPDVRTAIYSLGASVYQILTDSAPTDALERSIEILDGRADPLVAPSSIDPTISDELSGFILSCIQLKRERRFQTVAEARMALIIVPAFIRSATKATQAFDLDEIDLLEVPQAEVSIPPVAASPLTHGSSPLIFESSSDEDFLLTDVDLEDVPKISVSAVQAPLFLSSVEDQTIREKPNTFRWASLTVACVIIIAGVVWGVLSFPSSDNRIAGAEFNNGASEMKEPSAPKAQLPEPVILNKPESTVPEIIDSPDQPQVPTKPRPVIADSRAPKRAEAPQVAKPAAKPKKSVTVDDLINDN